MLLPYLDSHRIEAGCDEAGRGCLAGPVFAAAVILPPDFRNEQLNDSKQLTEKQRDELRQVIEQEALSWAVASVSAAEIDAINILNASIVAMHRAVAQLHLRPEHLLIDGNRFRTRRQLPQKAAQLVPDYPDIPATTIVKGDGKMLSIAAASILAKTWRDDYMNKLHDDYPVYQWQRNKGYPTAAHRAAIKTNGVSPWHRLSFRLTDEDDHPSLF